MSRRRFFRRGVWPVRLRPLLARIGVFLVLVMAVTLTVRCTRDLNPARGEGGVVLSWKAEPGGPIAAADSVRTWVLDNQDRILVGPVAAPFDTATGSFDISLRVPAGDDRAVRLHLEGAGGRGRGVMADGEARGITVPAAGTAEALLRLHNAVPRLEPFTGQPGDLQITLRWSSVPGASGYRLYRRPPAGPESLEVVGDTVRVFELSDRLRWSGETIGMGARAAGATKTRGWPRPDTGMSRHAGTTEALLRPAALDTTWFRVSALLHGGAVSCASDSVAVSFGWIEDIPHVLPGGVVPALGAIGVPDSVAVEIEFDRPMDPSSLGDVRVPSIGNTVTLRVDGTTDLVGLVVDSSSWRDGGRRLRLQPVTPLRRDAGYVLHVSTDLRDLDGRPLDQSRTEAGLQGFESRFDTEHYDPLRVTEAVPDSGAAGVAARPLIEIRLNRDARPATVNAQTVLLADSAGTATACTVTLPQESLIRVTPELPLRFSISYQLTVTTGVRDLRGRYGESLDQNPTRAGAQPFIRSFRTIPQPRGPRVIAVAPDSGATGVPLSQVVRVRFSRPVQAAAVNGYFTVLSPTQAAISGEVARSSDDRTQFTFTPTRLLEPGFLYTVHASGWLDSQGNPVGIRDDLGIPLDQDSTFAGYQEFRSTFRAEKNPKVDSMRPKPGWEGVPVDTLVELRFSGPIDRASVTASNLALFGGANSVPVEPPEWSVDNKLVRLRPVVPLGWYRTYTVVADTSLRSTDGSRFDQYAETSGYQPFRETFTTAPDGIPPQVASWTPGPVGRFPITTPVTLRFTKPVKPTDATSPSNVFLRKLPSGQALSADLTITLDSLETTLQPRAPLENDTRYEVRATRFIEDRFGQQLDQISATPDINDDFTGVFTTEIERVPPRVVAISPDLGELLVPANATIQVTFSEPMKADETLTGAFTLKGPGGAIVAGFGTPSPDGLRLVFTPAAPLRYAVRFDVRVDTTAVDLVGNPLDQNSGGLPAFTSWFMTAPDRVPPRVLVSVPANGDTAVKVTVNPEVTFDKAMAVTTLPGGLRLLNSLEMPVPLRDVEIRGDRHAVLIPADRLGFAELYTLEANDAAHDTSGNGLDQDHAQVGSQPFRVSFRTEDFPPRVAAVFPARDSSGVDPGVVVEIRFAAPVNSASVVLGFALYPDGSMVPVPGTVRKLSDTRFSYQPDAPLAPDSRFWVRVTAQVTDRAGNPLDQIPATPASDPFESGFRTGTPPVAPCTTGNGNSPPAKKVASLPVSAKTLGSARICTRFFSSNAWMATPRLMSERKIKTFSSWPRVIGIPEELIAVVDVEVELPVMV